MMTLKATASLALLLLAITIALWLGMCEVAPPHAAAEVVPTTPPVPSQATTPPERHAIAPQETEAIDSGDGLPSSKGEDLLAIVQRLAASGDYDELMRLYQSWVGQSATVDARLAILKAFAKIGDPLVAEQRIFAALDHEDLAMDRSTVERLMQPILEGHGSTAELPTNQALHLMANAGALLMVEVWQLFPAQHVDLEMRDRIRDLFLHGSPAVQMAVRCSMFFMHSRSNDPELSHDLELAYLAAENHNVRANLLMDMVRHAPDRVLAMVRDELDRPMAIEANRSLGASVGALRDLAVQHPTWGERAVATIFEIACREDVTEGCFLAAVEALQKLDADRLQVLVLQARSTNPRVRAHLERLARG